ncbi:hypothetical protein CAG71_12740 [Photobacterium halotolerans]|nr:hypothetical protein [Photobacterium halotolerans]
MSELFHILSSKFRMPQMLNGNPLFPTPDEASSYFWLPTSFRERAKLYAESLGVRDKLTTSLKIEPENTVELVTLLNKPKTVTCDKTPNRNEPCICGSGESDWKNLLD